MFDLQMILWLSACAVAVGATWAARLWIEAQERKDGR
jgi:hypothetical protein